MVAGYIITTIIGALVGFFFARWMFKRELKKNPPISENDSCYVYGNGT